MLSLIRWLRGFVVFELFGKFPERFINVCSRQGRSLFDASPCANGFLGSMLLCDYKTIRPLARRCGVRLRVKERHGLPFLLSRYRKRKGLLAGAAAFVAIIIIMQSFVWTVEVNGVHTLSTAEFSQVLREAGLRQGTFKAGFDLHSAERKIMQEVEEIGWMSINIIGTKAEVEIKEKDKKPEIISKEIPCNIKAAADGVIVRMNTKSGKAVVPVGSAVKEGQLLVSGVLENSLEEVSYVSSDAEIIAETISNITFDAKKSGNFKKPVSIAKRQSFDFLWLRIPVTFSPVSGEYSSRIVTEKLFLNDTAVACGRSIQYCTMYEDTSFTLSEDGAKAVLSADDALYRLFTLQNCETVSAVGAFSVRKDGYSLGVTYRCTEDIAIKENFVVN